MYLHDATYNALCSVKNSIRIEIQILCSTWFLYIVEYQWEEFNEKKIMLDVDFE